MFGFCDERFDAVNLTACLGYFILKCELVDSIQLVDCDIFRSVVPKVTDFVTKHSLVPGKS